MPKYAVGHLSSFENDLVIEIVDGISIADAITNHSKIKEHKFDTLNAIKDMDVDDIKMYFFDGDQAIDCVVLP